MEGRQITMRFLGGCERKDARALYTSAFPREEQLNFGILRALTIVRGIELNGFYEGDRFCGFTYTVETDRILFVLFFAVSEELRSNGYGSAILDLLKKSRPEKQILLNVEPLDESADNYDERVRRMSFYKKNGFFDTGYDIAEIGGIFRVLSTSPELDTKEYLKIFEKMSLGIWRPAITRAVDA